MKKKQHFDKNVYRSFTLILQFSLNMLVPICIMTAAGIFLDKKLGTSFLVIVGFAIGAVAGGQNNYRMAKGIFGEPQQKEKKKQDDGSADDR